MEDEVKLEGEQPNTVPEVDVFSELAGYQPEIIKDDDGQRIFNGKYVAEIVELDHRVGVGYNSGKPYDFYTLKVKVTEVVSGDNAMNWHFKKNFNNNVEDLKKLINILTTAGVAFSTKDRNEFDLSLPMAKGQLVKVSARGWTPDKDMRTGEVIPEENREERQTWKIVKDFSKPKGKKEKTATEDNTAVPF